MAAFLHHAWRGVLLLSMLACLCWTGVARGETLPGQFSDELNTDHYDCQLTVTPEANLPAGHTVTLALETGGGTQAVQCVISRAFIQLFSEVSGKRRLIGQVTSHIVPGKPYELTLLRRGTALALSQNHSILFHGTLPHGDGTKATITTETGWHVTSARIQRLEPVAFADDFMRASDEGQTALGAWTAVSGQWQLQSDKDNLPQGNGNKFTSTIFSENPFAWLGYSTGPTPAICTAGAPDWEDYTFSLALNPDAHGAVGVLANLEDAKNGLLVRWSPANTRGADGNALVLYRLTHGRRTRLATSPGGYVPGQWYRMEVVSSLHDVRVRIDGRERLSVPVGACWRGGIGLYSEGKDGSIFDDVTVYGHALDPLSLQENRLDHVGINFKKFLNDPNGMKEWAVDPEKWQSDPAVPSLYWYPETLYGALNWTYLTVTPAKNATGELELILHGDHRQPRESGYRAVLTLAGAPPRFTCTLYRGKEQLASKSVNPLTPDTDYSLRLTQSGKAISLSVDDTPVLHATDDHPLTGGQAGYRWDGPAFLRVAEPHCLSRNMLDYTFAEEPTDWWAVGTWMPSVRWACTPTWSFLGGWSRGDAVLWHKGTFTGDQMCEAFLGVKMEFPREREDYFFLRGPGYFAVTLCGDGKDPRSGYCGIYGAPDANGTPYKRAVLLRNGVEVGSAPIFAHSWGENHHEWFGLRLEKQGSTITFKVTRGPEKYAVTFTDAKPLAAGVPAIWTRNNAVSLARARINCANAPTPRNDPQVVIDNPWYPEWGDVGKPLTLQFADCWSTTGKPVSLRVIPRQVPPADSTAVTASGMSVHFTPTKPGDHWYQIVASDGANTSQSFHLDQTVFNPALGRDDTHALLLYCFDEGSGTTVHDRSKIAPALDLTVPAATNNARWLPGQGLSLHGPNPLATAKAADKLLALAKTKACTIEFWISSETIFFPYNLLAWEQNGLGCNLKINHQMNNLRFVTPAQSDAGWDTTFPRFRTSLQHYVFTWDGATTRCYVNGVLAGQEAVAWAPDRWRNGCPLSLGAYYLGSYYLFAIHDCCLTAEQIQRHYQAGPSAR